MKAKKFIVVSFIGFMSLLFSYTLLVDKLVIPERKVPYSYKQFALKAFSSIKGKVIVSSGSNSIHGIDSVKLSEYFNAPVFTYADNADYPLRSKIFSIEKYTNKGDIVLLPLEWKYYASRQHLSKNYIKAIADEELRIEFYFNSIPMLEKLRFIFTQYPLQQVIAGIKRERNKLSMLHSDLHQLDYFDRVVKSGDIAMLGNSIRNGPEDIIKVPFNNTCDKYLFSNGFEVSDYFKGNLSLLKRLTKKGVFVYFTWPATVDYKSSHCYQKNEIDKVNKYAAEIKERVEKEGYKFIGNYKQSHFPSHCFLNTYYHLKQECAILRTNILIDSIQESGLKPINNLSNIDVALMLNNEIARNKKEIEEELIILLPNLEKTTLTAGQLSHGLIFRSGWNPQEKWGIWSEGWESTLSFKINKSILTGKYIKITLKGRYFNGNEKTRVKINSLYYGEEELTSRSFMIPAGSIESDSIDITLQHSSVLSPSDLGISKDTRKIKFGLTELEIDSVN